MYVCHRPGQSRKGKTGLTDRQRDGQMSGGGGGGGGGGGVVSSDPNRSH